MSVTVALVSKSRFRSVERVAIDLSERRFGAVVAYLSGHRVRVAWADETELTEEDVDDVVLLGAVELSDEYVARATTVSLSEAAERVRSVVESASPR